MVEYIYNGKVMWKEYFIVKLEILPETYLEPLISLT